MAKIAKSLTDLIGNTPLLELSNYNRSILIRPGASKTGLGMP
jgi:hypothetical protein